MFAVIHLPQFALQAALRHETELWAKPVALVDSALSPPRVCELTDPARTAGVGEGSTPTQAMARCREISIRSRSLTQEAAATEAVLQCAYGFSPSIENTSPGTCTLDLRRLAELKRSGADALIIWAERLRTALGSLNLRARIGIAPTPSVARHAAKWATTHPGSSFEVTDSPCPVQGFRNRDIRIVTQPESFLASLPVEALDPSTDVAMILEKWGIRSVGELLALGQEALADRLGLEALALFAAASTTAIRPLNVVRPSERFEESFEFDQEVETIEPLLFILRRFVDQMSHRLELAGFVAELITLRLRLESGEALERRLRVPQPTRQADILFRMLHTHLETLRTDAPIIEVRLKAEPTTPEQKQFSLFEAALRDPHQFQETLARLSALVGSDRVGTPARENSHRPDAFKMVPPDFENAPSSIGRHAPELLRVTPLRRFRPAVKASVEPEEGKNRALPSDAETPSAHSTDVDRPVRGQAWLPLAVEENPSEEKSVADQPWASLPPKPVAIRCSVTKGRLKIVVGPWRASGRWWEPGAWQREEWDASTRDGQVLRLVQRADEWFVEGILD